MNILTCARYCMSKEEELATAKRFQKVLDERYPELLQHPKEQYRQALYDHVITQREYALLMSRPRPVNMVAEG